MLPEVNGKIYFGQYTLCVCGMKKDLLNYTMPSKETFLNSLKRHTQELWLIKKIKLFLRLTSQNGINFLVSVIICHFHLDNLKLQF